ncbi:MAG: YihA family ribosome biogenesis GTP-binding protein [Cytophagales bacterium]|nr:YihA family ribosome biogenesis GTP-binding protein [Cytophagales bacterium]
MKIKQIEFVKSSQELSQCPPAKLPEYAFIGRSNVGKSSLINALASKRIAKVSSVPGKTQLINHFKVDNTWFLVDLPGYGWAKVSKKIKDQWEENIHDYLLQRENLNCLFLLVDIRHDPQKNDMEFMEWLSECDIPFVLVFTKKDKLSSKNKIISHVARYKKILKTRWEVLPEMFLTSSSTGEGCDDILNYITQFNQIED